MIASDHAAFQKAIAADPADRTGRLVYADFLEETGEPAHVARADFIRAQIEADSLPPNDPRRAELLGRADGLFAEHWIDWWTPVCRAVGLRVPYIPGTRILERFARALGTNRPLGWPYHAGRSEVEGMPSGPGKFERTDRLRRAWFSRGYPEGLALMGTLASWARPIRRFAASFPLRSLQLSGILAQDWAAIAGDHLRRLEHLGLVGCTPDPVRAVLASAHLAGVTDLNLVADRTHAGWAEDLLRVLLASPLAPALVSLGVSLVNRGEAVVLAGAHRLTRLSRLTVRTGTDGRPGADAGASEVITALADAAVVGQLEWLNLDLWRGATGDRTPIHPAVEAAILRLLAALDPDRLRFLGLDGTQHDHPRVAGLIAARFADKVVMVR
jgi:uncharacterized protein (TIGR02996 family)